MANQFIFNTFGHGLPPTSCSNKARFNEINAQFNLYKEEQKVQKIDFNI